MSTFSKFLIISNLFISTFAYSANNTPTDFIIASDLLQNEKSSGNTVEYLGENSNISVLNFSGNYNLLENNSFNSAARQQVTTTLFSEVNDQYDFVVIFTSFPFDSNGLDAFATLVQNDIQGIGKPIFDNASLFGSDQLQLLIDMNQVDRWSFDPGHQDFEKTTDSLMHEIMHRWGVSVSYLNSSSQPSSNLLDLSGSHWSFFTQSNASIMYGSLWEDLGNGSFKSSKSMSSLSPLDLYLAGFLPTESVPDFFLIENAAQGNASDLPPAIGTTINGTRLNLSINDIIAAEGERTPDYLNAQHEFNVKFVLLKSAGENLSDQVITQLNLLQKEIRKRFATETNGLGQLRFNDQLTSQTPGQPETLSYNPNLRDFSLESALNFLAGHQKTDGSWGDKPATKVRDTAMAVHALKSINEEALVTEAGSHWLNHLTTEHYDDKAWMLLSNGLSAELSQSIAVELINAVNEDGGWGIDDRSQSSPLDTVLVLWALKHSLGASFEPTAAMKHYLEQNINPMTGVGVTEHGKNSLMGSALLLKTYHDIFADASAEQDLINHLLILQQVDGSFGEEGAAHETALSMDALINAHSQTQAENIESARNFLLANQSMDGSYQGSIFSTALALKLLAGEQQPNLAITDTQIIRTDLISGENAGIQFTVQNTGNQSLQTIEYRINREVAGVYSELVEVGIIHEINASQGHTINHYISTTDLTGQQSYQILVDPTNQIDESNELDNESLFTLTIEPTPAHAELAIQTGTLQYSPLTFNTVPFTVDVLVDVINLSSADLTDADVSLLQVDEFDNETVVATETIDLLALQQQTVHFNAPITISEEQIRLLIRIDHQNQFNETNETNNEIHFVVQRGDSVDLEILQSDVILPATGVVGNTQNISFNYRNRGTQPSSSFDIVVIVNGEPLFDQNISGLAAGEEQSRNFNWTPTEVGDYEIIFMLDSANDVPENDENNNSLTHLITVQSNTLTNLTIGTDDISIAPEPGLQGQQLTINLQVHNTSDVDSGSYALNLYQQRDGEQSQYITTLNGNNIAARSSEILQWNIDPMNEVGELNFVADIDPDNLVAEYDETDNSNKKLFRILSKPDALVSSGGFAISPSVPVLGQNLNVAVSVSNLGEQPLEQVEVNLYTHNSTTGNEQTAGSQIISLINAGQTQVVDFQFVFPNDAEIDELIVRVDETNNIDEGNENNNQANFSIASQSSKLYVTEKNFSPNGDGQKDQTQIIFNLDEVNTYQLSIYDDQNQLIKEFPPFVNTNFGDVIWDGKNDQGVIAKDGQYQIHLTSNTNSEQTNVWVDTNNSPLLDALAEGDSYATIREPIEDLSLYDCQFSNDNKHQYCLGSQRVDNVYQYSIVKVKHYGSVVTPLITQTSYIRIKAILPSDQLLITENDRKVWYLFTPSTGQKTLLFDGSSMEERKLSIISDDYIVLGPGGHDDPAGDNLLYKIYFESVRPPESLPMPEYQHELQMDPDYRGILYLEQSAYELDEIDGGWLLYYPLSPVWFIPEDDIESISQISDATYLHTRDENPALHRINISADQRKFIIKTNNRIEYFVVQNEIPVLKYAVESQFFDRPLYLGTGEGFFIWPEKNRVASLSPEGYLLLIRNENIEIYDTEGSKLFSFNHGYDEDYFKSLIDNPSLIAWHYEGSLEYARASDYHWGWYFLGAIPYNYHLAKNIRVEYPELSIHWISNTEVILAFSPVLKGDIVDAILEDGYWNDYGAEEIIGGYDMYLSDLNWLPSWAFSYKLSFSNPSQINITEITNSEVEYWVNYPKVTELSSKYFLLGDGIHEKHDLLLNKIEHGLDLRNTHPKFYEYGSTYEFSNSGFNEFYKVHYPEIINRAYEQNHQGDRIHHSTQNLTAYLKSRRIVNGFELSGLIFDRNMSHYTLEWADVTAPDQWNLITTGRGNQFDEVLINWIPPVEGAYKIRLMAYDTAGNKDSDEIKVRIGSINATITNPDVQPRLFSPNGDGVKDEVVISYDVAQATTVDINIEDRTGAIVRSYSYNYATGGASEQLIWDGRNDSGVLLEDGAYIIDIQGFRYEVTLDTVSPTVTLIQVNNRSTFSPDLGFIRKFGLEGTKEGILNSHGQLKVFKFCNLYLERYDETQNTWVDDVGCFRATPENLVKFNGQKYRLTHTDEAGNIGTSPIVTFNYDKFAEQAEISKINTSTGRIYHRDLWKGDNRPVTLNPEDHPNITDWSLSDKLAVSIQAFTNEVVESIGVTLSYDFTDPQTGQTSRRRINVSAQLADLSAVNQYYPEAYHDADVQAPGMFFIDRRIPYSAYLFELNKDDFPNTNNIIKVETTLYYGGGLIANSYFNVLFNISNENHRFESITITQDEVEREPDPLAKNALQYLVDNLTPNPELDYYWYFSHNLEPIFNSFVETKFPEAPELNENYLPVLEHSTDDYIIQVFALRNRNCERVTINLHGFNSSGHDISSGVETLAYPAEPFCPNVNISQIFYANEYCDAQVAVNQTAEINMKGTLAEDSTPPVSIELYREMADGSLELIFAKTDIEIEIVEGRRTFQENFAIDTANLPVGYNKYFVRLADLAGNVVEKGYILLVQKQAIFSQINQPQEFSHFCVAGEEGSDLLLPVNLNISDSTPHFIGVNQLVNGVMTRVPNPVTVPNVIATIDDGSGPVDIVDENNIYTEVLPEVNYQDFNDVESTLLFSSNIYRTILALELPPVNDDVSLIFETLNTAGVSKCNAVTFSVDSLVEASVIISAEKHYLSPNNDGVLDWIDYATIDVIEDVNLVVELWDGNPQVHNQGTLLGELEQHQLAAGASIDLRWDGHLAGQLQVENEHYYIRMLLTDNCGVYRELVTPVSLDLTPPNIQFIEPQTGSVLATINEVQAEVNEINYGQSYLDYQVDGAWTPIEFEVNQYGLSNIHEINAVWNLAQLQNNNYTLRLVSTDLAGNSQTASLDFNYTAQQNLFWDYGLSESYISPNGDGVKDQVEVIFGLNTSGTMTVQVFDQAGNEVLTLLNQQVYGQGSHSLIWNGQNNANQVVVDGIYTITTTAVDSADVNNVSSLSLSVNVDNTPPLPSWSLINDAVTKGNVLLSLGLQEQNPEQLVAWHQQLEPLTQESEILRAGINGHIDLLDLNTLSEGRHQVRVSIIDKAGNSTQSQIQFTVDNTPPELGVISPQDDSYWAEEVNITAQIEDDHFESYQVFAALDATLPVWQLIDSGTQLQDNQFETVWPVSLVDGHILIKVLAIDQAGWQTETINSITVDREAPVIHIQSPANQALLGRHFNIEGSITDANLQLYKISYKSTSTDPWQLITSGSENKIDELIHAWQNNLSSGDYSLQIVAQDHAGHISSKEIAFRIDGEIPPTPQHLMVELVNNQDAHLSWSPVNSPDLAGYHIYRNGQQLTQDVINAVSFVDAGLTEGEYTYWVMAIDHSGNASSPSNSKTVYVDQTPPDVLLITPSNGQIVSGQFDVLGTAYSSNDFASYQLHLRLDSEPAPGALIHESPQAISDGTLFELDTYQLADGGSYVLTLTANDLKGNSAQTSNGFLVDNTAPTTPLNLTHQLQNGNDVRLDWTANNEADLAGYLVYRNNQVISGHSDDAIIQNATPNNYYLDEDLPDGDYVYFVVAIDLAGNVSGQSNNVSFTLDANAPSVEFISPRYDSTFDQPIDLLVASDELDIAEVRFYYSPTTSGWILFDTVTSEPYQTTVNPIELGLNYGYVYFRAVAVDQSGRQDLSPPQLRLSYRDRTAPEPIANLTALVLGGDIQLNWDASDADDLQDYQIKRSLNGSSPLFIDTDVLQNNYLDSGLEDGEYYYEVFAVDTANNRSDKVISDTLTVYTLDIKQPFSPLLTPAQTQVTGKTHVPENIDMVLTHAGNSQNLSPIAVNGSGEFYSEVIDLELGLTSFTGQQTDINGNQSKPKSVAVEVSPVPLAPTNQQATVNGLELSYSWDAVPDSFGYLPYHNGEPIHQSERVLTGLTYEASSNVSSVNYVVNEVYDDNQYWSPSSSDRQDNSSNFVQINFDQPRWLTGGNIFWNVGTYGDVRKPSSYQLQYHSNVGWVTLNTIENNGIAMDEVRHEKPYLTDKVRIVMPIGVSSFEYVQLTELEIYHQPVITTNQFVQTMFDGHYDLQVSSINNYGFESALTSITPVDIGDVIAPEAVNLSGSTVAGENLLQWSASISPDVDYYRLFRNDEMILISQDNTTLDYSDSGLSNGSYDYKVQALDAAGNASPFSNVVTLVVEQTLLPAPENLQVTPVIEGSALQLSWNALNHAQLAYYQVYRSLNAVNNFEVINQLNDNQLLDEYLQNGTEYFYQVSAVDVFGNEGPRSAIVSGIPEDRSAPQKPVILSPTVSGIPVTIPETTSQVGGTAGAGHTVDLYVNSAYQQSTIVSTEFQLMEYAGLPYNYGILFNPQRDYYALFDNGQWLKLVNHETEETFSLENYQIYNNNPYFWSYDGEQLYAVHNETSPMKSLSIFDLQGRLIETVLTARDIKEVKVSTAGSYVYYTQSYYDSGAGTTLKFEWIYDTVSQTQIEVDWPIEKNWTAVWVDDKTLVFLNGDTSSEDYLKITSYNVESHSFEVLSDQVIDNNYSYFVWSAASQSFVYSMTINGFEQLEIFNQQSNSIIPLTLPNHDLWSPTFSPDGSYVFTFATDNENYNDWFVVFDVSNGNVVYIEQSDDYGDSATWHESGDVYIATTGFFKLKPPGQFNFESVSLRPGVNQLFVQSRNQSNVYSAYSDAIEIIVQADHLPDLMIEPGSLSINPANGLSGTAFTASFNVRNPSATNVSEASVLIQLLDPQGNQVNMNTAVFDFSLNAGQSRAFTVPFGELVEAGEYTVVIHVDHFNEVVELDETNNQQVHNFVVYENLNPIVSANLSSQLILQGEPLEAQLAVFNPGVNFNGQLLVSIVDANYYPVGYEQQYAIEDLTTESNWQSTFIWPANNVLAVAYKMLLQLTTNQGTEVAYEVYDFSINAFAQMNLSTEINAYVVELGSSLQIESLVQYLDGNSLEAGEISWSILDNTQQVIWNQSQSIPLMTAGYFNHFNQSWLSSATGQYQLQVELSTTHANKTNVIPFEVITPGEYVSLQGTIDNSANQLVMGLHNTLSFVASNNSNIPLNQVPLSLKLMSADLSTTLIEESFIHDFAVDESLTLSTSWLIDGLDLDNYLLVLGADLSNISGQSYQVLDTLVLTVIDADSPIINVIAPFNQQVVGKDVLLRFSAYDELSSLATINLSVDDVHHAEITVSTLSDNYEYWIFDLTEGMHILELQAIDIYGNSNTENWTIVVDTTPPVITVVGVEQSGIYNTGVQPLITVNDDNLDTYSITLDGQPYTSNTLINAEGTHLLHISAKDVAGNQANLQISFYQDFTSPEIVVTYPVTGSETVVALTPVTGTTEQDATVYLTVGSYQDTTEANSDGTFNFEEVPLLNGNNSIELYAIDVAGNQGPTAVVEILLLQSIDVSGEITAPDSHVIGDDLNILFSLTNLNASQVNALNTELLVINDLNQEMVMSYSVEVSIAPNGIYHDQSALVTATLEPRNYRVILQTLINGSWQVQDTQVLTLTDQTPPTINVISPINGEVYATNVPFKVAVNDLSSDIQLVEYQVDQSGNWVAMPLVNGFYETETLLSHGTHQVIFRASDTSSNETMTSAIGFEVDNLAPVITITAPQNGLKTNQSVTLNFNVEDDNLEQTAATLNGLPVSNGDVISADGGYQLIIFAVDNVGNQSEKTSIFIIDTIAPELVIDEPIDNSQVNDSVIAVIGRSEPNATVYLNLGAFSDSVLVDAAGDFEFSEVPLEPGLNQLLLFAEDEFGNASVTQLVNVELMMAEALTGVVWHDANSNQEQDNGESGLSNVSVQLTNLSTQNQTSVFTDSQGAYAFNDLSTGDYLLLVTDELSVIDGWQNTTNNNPAQVHLSNSATQSINFGFTDVELITAVNQEHDRGRVLVLLDEAQPLLDAGSCESVTSWSLQTAIKNTSTETQFTVDLYDVNHDLIQTESATLEQLTLDMDYPLDHENNANIDLIQDNVAVNLSLQKLRFGYLNAVVEAHNSNGLNTGYYIKLRINDEPTAQSTAISHECGQLVEAELKLGSQLGDFVLSSLTASPAGTIDEPFGPEAAPNLSVQRLTLENLLQQNGWSYTITTDVDSFIAEFDTGQYLTYVVFSEQHKLPKELLNAMSSVHEQGDALFMAGSHDNRNKQLYDLLGVKHQGKHNQHTGVELLESVLHGATEFDLALDEKPLKISLQGATVAGIFKGTNGNDNADSALTYIEKLLDETTSSRGVFVSFDLLLQATYAETFSYYSEILINALSYLQENQTAAQLGKAQALQLRIQNLATEISGQVYINIPAGTTLVASSHEIQSDNQSQWVVYDLDENQEAVIEFWFVLTESPQLIEFQIKANPDGRLVETLSFELVAE